MGYSKCSILTLLAERCVTIYLSSASIFPPFPFFSSGKEGRGSALAGTYAPWSALAGTYADNPDESLDMQVDPLRNLIYVKGQVPGHKGNFVRVKDAVKKRFAEQPQRPFPTFLEQYTGGVVYAPKEEHNPFEPRER